MPKTVRVIEPKWLLIVIFFIAGILLGSIVLYILISSPINNVIRISARTGYKYINPLLAFDIYPQQKFSENIVLETQIQTIIKTFRARGTISDSGVYFRDLEPAVWIGINEDKILSPGKLLTIPIMIAYYTLAETEPELLNKELEIKSDEIFRGENLFATGEGVKVGEKYTVEELIKRMIVNSDSIAANVLFDDIDKNALNEIFSDLGINFKEDKDTADFISLKQYSLFFRILRNATYLNKNFSEKALELLVESPSYNALGIDLPKDVPIANLIGGRSFLEHNQKSFEIYDCGIVYYPHHPYLICAVAQGKNLEEIKNFFKEVGLSIYKEIGFRYGE